MARRVSCKKCGCDRFGERWDVKAKQFYQVCSDCGTRRPAKAARRTKRKRAKRGTKSSHR